MSCHLPMRPFSAQQDPVSPAISAVDRVFGTNELLEAILVLLPLPSLFRVHSVCGRWLSVIKGSSKLQQAVFLQPAKDETAWLVDITNLPSEIHPLKRDYKSSLHVKAAVSKSSREYNDHRSLIAIPVRLNPLFLQPAETSNASPDIDAKVDFPNAVEFSISWRRLRQLELHSAMEMFFTAPPVRQVCVEWSAGESDRAEILFTLLRNPFMRARSEREAKTICQEDGVRLRHVYDAISQMDHREVLGVGIVRMFLNGVVVVEEEDENVVGERTREWRRKQMGLSDRLDQKARNAW